LWFQRVSDFSITTRAGRLYLSMKIENRLSWMCVVGGALVADAGCTAEDSAHVTRMYATTGGETVGLRAVSVDSATYAALVDALGTAPVDVALASDAPDGTVQVHLAPTSPLVAMYLADPAGVPSAPPLTITFDDGTSEPVGLLVPAVQKIREAAVHGSSASSAQTAGTLAITLEGQATVGGGVRVAVGDVTGDGRDAPASVFVVGTHVPGVSPEQRTAMADAFVSPAGVTTASLDSGNTGTLILNGLTLPNTELLGRWKATGATMNLVLDIRSDGGGLTRFRMPRAVAPTTGQARAHVKVFDGQTGQPASSDAARAMFDAGYSTFTSDALDTAARALLDYANAGSMSLAIAQWGTGRTQLLADIIVATGPGGAPGYEAMACTAALPTALAVANGLDLTKDENASAAMTVIEATAEVAPKVGLVSGGALALQTYGAPAPAGDAELACAAVHQLASLPDSLLTAEGKAIRALSIELSSFDARRLEIELADWIAAMDSIKASPNENAWAAAKTKADILVDSLGNASTRTQARWALAADLLGR
jgi:hypothetical protein